MDQLQRCGEGQGAIDGAAPRHQHQEAFAVSKCEGQGLAIPKFLEPRGAGGIYTPLSLSSFSWTSCWCFLLAKPQTQQVK